MADENVATLTSPIESPASDGADTSTESTQTETPQGQETAKPEPKDWRKIQREDPSLNDHIRAEIKAAQLREERRRIRDTAKQAVASGDRDTALRVSQQVANETDAEDEAFATLKAKADRVQPQINALSNTPEYTELWKQHRADWERRWNEDPEAAVEFISDAVLDARATTKAKAMAKDLAEGLSLDQTQRALRNVGVPLGTASGGTGTLTAERYATMTRTERAQLRKTNPDAVNRLASSLDL